MKPISGLEQRRMRQDTLSMLYNAQVMRIEWESTTDDGTGVLIDAPDAGINPDITGYNKFYKTTPRTSSSDQWYLFTSTIHAKIHIIDEFDIKHINDTRVVIGDAVILITNDLNLRSKDNLRFIQMINSVRITGTATGSGNTWTDSSKSWTTDQWKGYYFVLSNKRFKILSNTATVLTIEPAGLEIDDDLDFDSAESEFEDCDITMGGEEDTISYTIQPTIAWYPKLLSPGIGAFVVIGDEIPLQTIFCSREQQSGQV